MGERTNVKQSFRREFSAGGVVFDEKERKVLMILVENLSGKKVWTFPKGHIEEGESKEQTALREVEEEAGWRTKIVKPLGDVTYYFKDKDGTLIKKTVFWYLMEPVEKSEVKTPDEVIDVKWFPIDEAKKVAVYDSDKRMLRELEKMFSK